MKKSIRNKIFWGFLLSMISILIGTWLIIHFFAQSYYEKKVISSMEQKVKEVKQVLLNNEDYNTIVTSLDSISLKSDSKLIIINNKNQIIYTGNTGIGRMGQIGKMQLKRHEISLLAQLANENLNGDENKFNGKIKGLFGNEELLVYGEKDSLGNTILTNIPTVAIQETVKIIQSLLGYVLIFACFLVFISSFILSRNITKPITKLNSIAREMGNLNFTLKYNEKREDEIGQLGKTLNVLTIKLEKTINELQNELQKEKSLDKFRKMFVAQVSHELQTPLAIINGYVEALQDDILESEEEKKYHYYVIEDEVKKMSKIVRDLLDLSQLEAGVFKISKTKINYRALLTNISNKFKVLAEQKGIEFRQDLYSEDVFINGDAIRIEQAVTNILQNAFQYTEKGGLVKIQLYENGDKLLLNIINTGKHIPENELQYVFESFYKTKRKSKKGTGLGLAITKNILLLHDCNYYVRNIEEGVCFGFDIRKMK